LAFGPAVTLNGMPRYICAVVPKPVPSVAALVVPAVATAVATVFLTRHLL
jgi:hypothetical protein